MRDLSLLQIQMRDYDGYRVSNLPSVFSLPPTPPLPPTPSPHSSPHSLPLLPHSLPLLPHFSLTLPHSLEHEGRLRITLTVHTLERVSGWNISAVTRTCLRSGLISIYLPVVIDISLKPPAAYTRPTTAHTQPTVHHMRLVSY